MVSTETITILVSVLSIFTILVITVLLVVLFTNKRSTCKNGFYSRDGKGSFIDPCITCPKCEDGDCDAGKLVKGLPNGTYQCPLGRLDGTLDKGTKALESLIGDYATAIPAMMNFGQGQGPGQGPGQTGECLKQYETGVVPIARGQTIYNQALVDEIQDKLPGCKLYQSSSGGTTNEPNSLILSTDNEDIIQGVAINN
jgi:hypothetical protein